MSSFPIDVTINATQATSGINRVERALGRTENNAEDLRRELVRALSIRDAALNRTLDNVNRRLRKAEGRASRLNKTIGRAALAGSAFLLGRAFLRTANSAQQLDNRLRVVTDSSDELESVNDDLVNVARATRAEFGATVQLYSRLSLAAGDLGKSQSEVLNLTRRLNQAVTISGASADEARNAILQLSQGIASGALRGDELRSVLEQLPVVADVIARQLGVTRGELRELGSQGKITADLVFDAFESAGSELDAGLAKTVPTLSQSMTGLGNETLQLVRDFDKATGISNALGQGISAIGDGINFLREALNNFQERVDQAENEGVLSGTGSQIVQLERQIKLLKERDDLNEDNLRFLEQLEKRLRIARSIAREPVEIQAERAATEEARTAPPPREVVSFIRQLSVSLGDAREAVDDLVDSSGRSVNVLTMVLAPLERENELLKSIGTETEDLVRRKQFELELREQGIAATDEEINQAIRLQRENDLLRENIVQTTTFGEGLRIGLLGVREEAADLARVGIDVVDVFANRATNALTEFATTGRFVFKEFASAIIDDLIAITARLLIVQGLSAAFTGGTGGGLLGGFASTLGGGLNAGRQRGGTVQPGQRPFPVNEQGEELFIPGRTTTIVPAPVAAPAQAQQQDPPMIVNVTDPNEFEDALESGNLDRAVLNVVARNPQKFASLTPR